MGTVTEIVAMDNHLDNAGHGDHERDDDNGNGEQDKPDKTNDDEDKEIRVKLMKVKRGGMTVYK